MELSSPNLNIFLKRLLYFRKEIGKPENKKFLVHYGMKLSYIFSKFVII